MKRVFVLFCAACLLFSCFSAIPMTVNAASNPYPVYQDVNGNGRREVRCTYYAWQQAYDRLGVALPAWGNAITWYNSARNAGYAVGTTPQANAIAVWSQDTHTMGHVAFVTAVNGSQMTVNEGGRTDREDVEGVINGQVVPSTVGQYWYGRTLVGFIYLTAAPTVSLSWGQYADKHWIGSTNAVLAARCNMNVDNSAVSQAGIYLYNYKGTQLVAKTENTSLGGQSYFNVWFDVNGELGYSLAPGTPYKYKFVAVIGGKTYYSPVYTFTTTGSHTHRYNSGLVTKQPTCTGTGTRTYTCSTCGGTKKESIAAKGHTYAAATCTAAKTCKVCSATRGKALGHTYKTTITKATLSKSGKTVKKCATCGKVVSTTIKRVKTIKLSATSYTYNGKVKTPSVTVKDSSGKTLKKGTDYTVSYSSGRKKVGTYKVTVKMKGNYSGSKTLTFKIVPKAASINKLTAKNRAITVKLNRSLQQSTGYEVQYSTSKSFKSVKTKVIKSYKTSMVTLSGLKAKTTYYVRIRTYKIVGGTKFNSNWCTYKRIKTK